MHDDGKALDATENHTYKNGLNGHFMLYLFYHNKKKVIVEAEVIKKWHYYVKMTKNFKI